MIDIRYVEYDTSHSGDFVFDIPDGHDCWLIILTHTPAVFLVDKEMREYPPNCAVVYKPFNRIYYRACSEFFSDDWIRFETDESYITAAPIPGGVPFMINDPSYCHKLFQLLTVEHILNSNYKSITLDNLMRVLSNKLLESNEYKRTSPLLRNLNELRTDVYLRPNEDWTVKKMADRLNISTGYLADIYKSTFGEKCMDDVIKSRINLAKKYLMYDNYTISEIVSLCGYRNAEHFYRQFKKITGMTPNSFRKKPF